MSEWVDRLERRMEAFAIQYSAVFVKTKRQQSAVFEIGCFLCLVQDYARQGCDITLENLGPSGEYRFLTSPSGNPENFSHVVATQGASRVRIRQQTRVR